MSSFPLSWPKALDLLLEGNDLSFADSEHLMKAWLKEELSPVQTGAFLGGLRAKGVNGVELGAMAKVLREACALPSEKPSFRLVDTCGTGGDGADTFNISTAVAFVAASCGAKVAKHGNRSASGKVGSADVLEALGLKLNCPLEEVVGAIDHANVSFLFAPAWHKSLVNLAPLRKSLGVRTVFNLLGPLVNPLGPEAQVLGVATHSLLDPMANALQSLRLDRAVVVYGAGGLDEASLEGPNEVRLLKNGELTSAFIDPTDFGLSQASNELLRGGDIALNKDILKTVLQGRGTHSQRDVVALNTSLVLWAAGLEDNLKTGVSVALDSLQKGRPWDYFVKLKDHLD